MSPEQQALNNILLRSLDPASYEALRPEFERVKLERGQEIVTSGEEPSHICFPEGGVCSTVVVARPAEVPTEVLLFGREGVSGMSALLGAGGTPLETVVQVEGPAALRIETAAMKERIDRDPALRTLIQLYAHVTMIQLAMNAAAHLRHQLEARLSRWILMCCDRIDGNELALTHEFMSIMLGVRRSSVTVTLHQLEGMGAIRTGRGAVFIRDRAKLQDLAGETYGPAEEEYRRLIGQLPVPA